ncbi:Dihydrofolate reductase OS=Streptomyces alboniger OX=132473 GN=CP975_25295 PE=3 SV=1 [Streptomyces alboniger]
MPGMRSVQVVQTLSAGTDDAVEPGLKHLRPGVRLCNARGVHEASTAELALTLVLASLRGVPGFVRAQDRGEWRGEFRSTGGPERPRRGIRLDRISDRGPARSVRGSACGARRALRAHHQARGPVHPLTELPSLLPEANMW